MAKKITAKNKKFTRDEFKKLYEKTKNELEILSEITNAMMQSLEPEQVIYTILTALTSHGGFGFDRAMFFLVNKEKHTLEGKMAIGPHSPGEMDNIWHHMDDKGLTLQNLIDSYNKFKNDPGSKLNDIVKGITIPLDESMGILALTILEGMPFEIKTENAKSMVNDKVKKLLNTNFFVTIPLKTRDQILGAILVDNVLSRKPITDDNLRILNMFADHAALAIENSRLYEKTVHLSRTDWLTGLWNTRYLDETLGEKLKAAVKNKINLSLLMIDIDNFKKYNDSLGHQEGDQAIKRVANLLHRFSRKTDFVCRYGGEEFCTIMSKTSKSDAYIIAERLRSEIENYFIHDNSVPEDIKLTISLGLAVYPYDGKTKDDLIKKADLALYHAKQNGKNKTCAYSPDLEDEK